MGDIDGQLYRRFLTDNDQDALGSLYEEYKDSLMLFIYGMIRDMDEAEELMMDTFAVLASGTAKYREKNNSSFKTWLFAIAKNKACQFLRRQRRFLSSEESDVEEIADTNRLPEDEMLENEKNKILYHALEKINPSYRQVLYLMYFEDLKHDQIGRIMSKTTKQTYNLAARGKVALRAELERMGATWDM
ncbi:MAG: RNA polymerase sigma factor [Clostridiales bacterium]|nr:RNA polymerase sigma factor [Clostridiales bacterium]